MEPIPPARWPGFRRLICRGYNDISSTAGLAVSKKSARSGASLQSVLITAEALHNLAFYSALDFVGFSEDFFWAETERMARREPALRAYREVFLRGMRSADRT